jgi:diguanylate cyclase (GGDEF)-like protein
MQHLAQLETVADVSVLFIDLDGFKEVNDALGHESGDGVLRDVAHRIASCAPAGVYVARLGGDEFLAVMADSLMADGMADGSESSALRAAEGFIAGIEDLGATLTRFPLSASIGIAIGFATESAEQLLHRADQAMYKAKAAGPGRCELAQTPETSPGLGPSAASAVGPSRGGFGGPIPVR